MRYYSTQRPVMPGSFPKPAGNMPSEIESFDQRTFCEDIGREAWGYIEYPAPLSEKDAKDCELVAANGAGSPAKQEVRA